tara:strand:- start:3765 stop:4718 length:954 start_codon:yes stop_codon:yes gene_type:complete
MSAYTIADFNRISSTGFSYTLDDSVIKTIQNIAEQVGAPEYIRTPQFPKRGGNQHVRGKRRHKAQEITEDDWQAIRDFKATEIIKKEGIDASIDNIRKLLNKISNQSYDILQQQIIKEISTITENKDPEGDILVELHKVGDAIFNIASSNGFYSEMYAKLYKSLMENFSFMENIFDKNYKVFGEIFKTIEYCNPDTDYNKFCEINKTNEKRRAVSLFYVNLMKENIIPEESIINIIIEVQNYMNILMENEENKEVIDELSEVIYILVTNSFIILKEMDKWPSIIENIINISKMTIKTKPGLSNKTIFKHMDIVDELE